MSLDTTETVGNRLEEPFRPPRSKYVSPRAFVQFPAVEIVGLGIDLCEIERVEGMLAKYPRFPERIFTEHERAYASRFARPARRYAARFAGKEAVMKSLSTGWRRIRWRDVEITGGGAPRVNLTGTAQARAQALGVTKVLVTITHTDTTAMVLAVSLAE